MGGRRKPERRVYPRGDMWWGIFPREKGESKRESLGLPITAPEDDALELWLARAKRDRAAAPADKTPRVGALFDEYIKAQRRRKRSEATLEIDLRAAGHFLGEWGRNMPTRLITAQLVDDWITTCETETRMGSSTIGRELAVLRCALKLAIHKGTFTTPLERVMPLGYNGKSNAKTTWITERDAERIYHELPEERRGWFAFAIATGSRRGEVERAELDDVGERWILVRGTKTKKSHAKVPILTITRPWVERAVEHAREEGKAFVRWGNVLRGLRHACDALSTCKACREGRGPNCEGPNGNVLRRRVPDPMCDKCRATPRVPRVTPNDLRRSVGMWLRDGGVEPNLIAKFLRHADARMAEIHYARGSDEGTLAAIEAQLSVTHRLRAPKIRRPKRRTA